MLAAVATKVNGVVMTSSPLWMPSACSAKTRASEPDAHPIANFTPMASATCFSNSATSGPRINCWFSNTCCAACSTSERIAANCAFRSRKGNSSGVCSSSTITPGCEADIISSPGKNALRLPVQNARLDRVIRDESRTKRGGGGSSRFQRVFRTREAAIATPHHIHSARL